MEDILTAHGQLALASEFRFDYWHTEAEHRYFTVRRGRNRNDGKWAICDGGESSAYWNGTEFSFELRGPEAYRYALEVALVIAKRLAFEENQRTVEILENAVGGIRGGPYDMAARKAR